MNDVVSGLPGLGKTLLTGPNRTAPTSSNYGTSKDLEGFTRTFEDRDPSSGVGIKPLRSNRAKICRLVRNVSGIALLPKRIVTYAAGYIGKRVDGYCRLDFVRCAGVVDEWLPTAGAPTDDLFWITVKGPTLIKTSLGADATAVINEGDQLVALTAATSQATTAGRVQSFAATSNLTNAMSAAFNRFGTAMSAKTTANTNADVLADVDFGN